MRLRTLTVMAMAAVLTVGAVVEAAPRARKAAKTQKARGEKPRRPRPAPRVQDDPSEPLGVSWRRQIDRYFEQNRPEFGAFVAIDVATGEPIAVSDYSANARVPHPATTAAFPAASIFKVVTAAALLETGTVRPGTTACYSGGSHSLEEAHIRDSRRDRACRSLASAFAHSTNAVFGKLAVRHLDASRLLSVAERLGFNRTVRVGDLQAESRATAPAGDLALARMAAGFTNSTLAPLHGAVIAAIVANGGVIPAGVSFAATPPGARVLSADVAARLREMMVLTSTGGTASKYLARYQRHGGVAVKTGTLTSTDGSGLFNTWMVGFFPAVRPEFAFAALVSTRGSGPVKAGHLTRHAIETFLKIKRARISQS